jgi:rsbT antagonist protein RsbS
MSDSPTAASGKPATRTARDVVRVPMHVSRGCLIVSLQVDLDEPMLRQLRTDLLERLRATRVEHVILDVGGLEILDAREFEEVRRTLRMAEIMGARTVLVGLRAGIVSSLVDLQVDVGGLTATIDMDEAFRILERGGRDVVG